MHFYEKVMNSTNNYQNYMAEKMEKIKNKNKKNQEAIVKCNIYHEEKKEKNIHKSDVLQS